MVAFNSFSKNPLNISLGSACFASGSGTLQEVVSELILRDLATSILLEFFDEVFDNIFGGTILAESSTEILSGEDTVVVGVGVGEHVLSEFLDLSLGFLG